MAKSNKTQETVNEAAVVEAASKTEKFFNENKKTIWGCVGAAVVIAIAVLCYTNFYLTPKKAEASAQMYPAEQLFENGQYETALNGDGNNLGFADIISQYGSKAGAAVYYYAGVCELQTGKFEEAISYLKKYNGKDPILKARAICNIGDAYVGLEDYKTAVGYFEKAAATADNIYAAGYLLKAGVCYEDGLGDKAKALEAYKTIKEKYPQSMEGYEIDKYISRIEEEEK